MIWGRVCRTTATLKTLQGWRGIAGPSAPISTWVTQSDNDLQVTVRIWRATKGSFHHSFGVWNYLSWTVFLHDFSCIWLEWFNSKLYSLESSKIAKDDPEKTKAYLGWAILTMTLRKYGKIYEICLAHVFNGNNMQTESLKYTFFTRITFIRSSRLTFWSDCFGYHKNYLK